MFYARLPSAQEAAAAGFELADYEEEAEIWPENWPAFALFSSLQTQWKVGMAGPTGLDYATLFLLLDRHQLVGDEWWQMFGDIRLCEATALKTMQEAARQ
ncbi:MAG: DUF1799 domain-containing protein [Mizugakiibacter sp.]|uniref:DUF1799 domain-containing protein n=1 Tax=Mizugakiibacter sp. TaxID=1972610 RepID=UPI00320FF85B